jgi:transposase
MDRCRQKKIPEILNMTQDEIDEQIARLKDSGLDAGSIKFFTACVDLAVWLPEALKEKDISINNLRKTLFGETGSKKKKKKNTDKNAKNDANDNAEKNDGEDKPEDTVNQAEPSDQSNQNSNIIDIKTPLNKKSGHGRMGHGVYKNALQVTVAHSVYKVGDYCPESCGGRLYQFKPGIVVRITGNLPATVKEFTVEALRCALCNTVFKANLPYGVSDEKYDEAFKAVLSIQKYYMGAPFYRQEAYFAMLGSPVADATQFDLCEDVANAAYPVIGALEKIAANAEVSHFDDTHAKILSVIAENKKNIGKERTGMFTTGIIAKTFDETTIALFYTGKLHAGENMKALLKHRISDKEKMIAMCDALAANMPKALKAIICNCLSHGFRKFRDLLDYFPQICLHVMQELGKVYQFDAQTKSMTKLERLAFHRENSKPIMLKLHIFLKKQFEDKEVEPNSALGKSIQYMLKHWKKLRRFLTTPGAPIDNNIVERALKIPIRNRKNAMFYKTLHGATIGNILQSLIYTAKLTGVNPVDYLVALQKNKSAVHKNPADWVPWMYQKTLESMALNIAA